MVPYGENQTIPQNRNVAQMSNFVPTPHYDTYMYGIPRSIGQVQMPYHPYGNIQPPLPPPPPSNPNPNTNNGMISGNSGDIGQYFGNYNTH